ncbi:NOP58 (predicted), partial [Pycnogonum litorale]
NNCLFPRGGGGIFVTMLVLFETSAGYAIFKLANEKKLNEIDNLYEDFESPESASKVVKLKQLELFKDTSDALAATASAVEGKIGKKLKKVLKKLVVTDAKEQLAVADSKLGSMIKDKFGIHCVSNSSIIELLRCMRSQADSLLTGIKQKDLTQMSLGLAHGLSRYKLKFSPDKIDTMIVHAVSLLDDLDKELNNYTMRCREWYGWHFPELGKVITDNAAYVKTVKTVGMRTNFANADLSEIVPEDIEAKCKEVAEISMGVEIADEDMSNIVELCDQVIEMTLYREQLYEYLRSRMMAIAPNLSVLVGDLVGARLISHAGSLLNLAKHPASTVQILGAEKALFRSLKTKHNTPKYGLLYHAQLVGQTGPALKGKAARMLATKAALGCRVDAFGESENADLGIHHRVNLEKRLKALQDGGIRRISGTGKQRAKFDKYENTSTIREYPLDADSSIPSSKKRKFDDEDVDEESKP